MNENLFAIIASSLSFLVASVSLGWNIYRDVIARPRLKVTAYMSDEVVENKVERSYLTLSATNIGERSLFVAGYRFNTQDGSHIIFENGPLDFHQLPKLSPQESRTIHFNPEHVQYLASRVNELVGLEVHDTIGRHWPVPEKEFQEILKLLKKASLS